jgi:hypothetical protein
MPWSISFVHTYKASPYSKGTSLWMISTYFSNKNPLVERNVEQCVEVVLGFWLYCRNSPLSVSLLEWIGQGCSVSRRLSDADTSDVQHPPRTSAGWHAIRQSRPPGGVAVRWVEWPSAKWSGRPLADSYHGRANGQTRPTDIFWMRFSRKTSKMTTLELGCHISNWSRWKSSRSWSISF